MAEGVNQDSPVELALADGVPQHFGWYRFFFADERWEWSPEVARIHGYEPGSVTPTTRLVLSHKHPEDYEHVAVRLSKTSADHTGRSAPVTASSPCRAPLARSWSSANECTTTPAR